MRKPRRLGPFSSSQPIQTHLLLKRRAGAGSYRRKTDGTDRSELQNTLKGKEYGKGAEVRNKVKGETWSV